MNREAAHQRQEAATLRLSGARLSLEGRLQIADVWIAGPNIRSIGEPPPDITPDGVEDLRCDGLTCVPGLIDLHVHACAAGRGMVEDLHTCLLRGITTVRDLGGPLAVLGQVPVWADKLGMAIPRLARAGPILTARGGHPVSTILAGLSSLAGAAAVQLDDANAARAEVRHLSQASVDLIKVAFSSRRASRPDIVVPRLALGILAAIIDEASRHGLFVVAHTATAEDVLEASRAGVRGVEHGAVLEAVGAALAAELAERRTVVVPTLAVVESLTPELLPLAKRNVATLFEAGVQIGAGSDAGNGAVRLGEGLIREMELLEASGLPGAA